MAPVQDTDDAGDRDESMQNKVFPFDYLWHAKS
jgi:hypothetical protein